MKDHLTILQNFIITNESILNHLKSDVGLKATSNVLGECKWVVNYKTSLYLDEIKTLYNNYLTDYDLYNNIEDNTFTWATSTLALLKTIKTPYVFYLTEDRMFHKTTQSEFFEVMEEVVKNNLGLFHIGKIQKYIRPQYVNNVPYNSDNKHIYTFLCKNAPGNCLSIDTIFRKDILEKSLERLLHTKDKIPHVLEYERGIWLSKIMPDMLCGLPKNEIIVSDDDPGYSLGK